MDGIQKLIKLNTIFLCLLCGMSPCIAADVWTDLELGGGNVNVVAVAPSDPQRIFAGIWSGDGLYRSIDGAATWQALKMEEHYTGEDTFANQVVLALSISQVNPRVIWAAHNYWISKSEDGGDTWIHILNSTVQRDCDNCGGATDNFRFVYALASDPGDAGVVYVGTAGAWSTYTAGAVYKSIDGGVSWEKLNQGVDLDYPVTSLAVDPHNPLIVWAATDNFGVGGVWDGTLYRSTDGGQNWTPTADKPFFYGLLTGVTAHPSDAEQIFVTGSGGLARGVYDGARWNFSYPIAGCAVADGLAFSPSNPDIVYVGWKTPISWGGDDLPKVSCSLDSGLTWETYTLDPAMVSYPQTMAVDPIDPSIVYLGDNSGGVVKSIDHGKNWVPVNSGLRGIVVNDVATDDNETTHLIAATSGGVFERISGSWVRRLINASYSIAFVPGSSNVFYAGLWNDMAMTIDNGTTWNISAGVADGDIKDIAIDPINHQTIFIADNSYVRRSLDGGDTFVPVLEGINRSGEAHDMNTIAFDPADSSHVYAGGGIFSSPRIVGDLWESKDRGDTWQRTGLTDKIVNKVIIDPRNSGILYAGCGYSSNDDPPVLKSIDAGVTWAPAEIGLPNRELGYTTVWGSSETGVYAASGLSRISYYDGNALDDVYSDTIQPTSLYDIFGTDAAHIYAVGKNGTILQSESGTWASMQSNTAETLYGVWGAAPDDLFAVGSRGTILHFDGTDWNPMTSGTTALLREVQGTGSHNVYAVGENGTILHYDGTTWSAMQSPTRNYLGAIWVASANAIFAGGSNGTMIFYDGTTWSSMNSDCQFFINALWGNDADDVYAVADEKGLILHFDGNSWTSSTIPDALNLYGVWSTPGGVVFVSDQHGGLFRYDGIQWEVLRASGTRFRSVTDLAFHRLNPDILYAATWQAGVFVSPNQAEQWLNLGTPVGQVNAVTSGSLYAGTSSGMFQLTGTGVVAGDIFDAATSTMVDGAMVYTDLGIQSTSINGEYMMVSPAGICSVTAVADGYRTATSQNVMVLGSDVAWVDMDLVGSVVGVSEGASDAQVYDTASGGSYCFIGMAFEDMTLDANGHLSRSGKFIIALTVAILLFIAFLPRIYLFSTFSGRRKLLTSPKTVFYALCILLLATQNLNAGTIFQNVGISGSPNPVGSGARAQGMGGAFIGIADDATAASWNPAGLIQLETSEASIVGVYQKFEEEFTSDLHPEINTSGDTSDTNINYISLTYPFHWHRNMVVSLNYQRLYDFQRTFSHQFNYADAGLDLSQQKNYEQNGFVGALGLAGAIEISPIFSLGLTINFWTDQLFWENGWTENYTEHSEGIVGGSTTSIDTSIRDEYSEFRGINANIGLLYNPSPSVTIGAVVKTPFTASLRHEFLYSQAQVIGSPVDDTFTSSLTIIEDASLEMPLSYGLGLAWRVSDILTIDADIYRTHWSDYILEDDAGNRFNPIDGNFKSQADVEDTIQVRFGAEYLIIIPEKELVIPLRGGIYYDPEPGSGSTRDFYGLALGSGIAWKKLIFDLAYNYRWGNSVNAGNLIATSKADVSQHTILASLIFHF